MNRLETNLRGLDFSISFFEALLEHHKNIRYEDWCQAHAYLDALKERREKLLERKFGDEMLQLVVKKNMSNKKLDGMPIKISVRFETELLQRELDKLDLENMGLSELKEIIQEHMIVTLANVGPKGICFPGREEDEEIINKIR